MLNETYFNLAVGYTGDFLISPTRSEDGLDYHLMQAALCSLFVTFLTFTTGMLPGYPGGTVIPLIVPDTTGPKASNHLFDPYR